MTEPSRNKDNGSTSSPSKEGGKTPVRRKPLGGEAVSKAVSDFVNGLSNEHRMLIVLKAQLYDGTWEPMLDDLQNRLAGKPYIFKLANRIQDDIERIKQMQEFEAEHKIDLADYIDLP
jgi:hypothetical protein